MKTLKLILVGAVAALTLQTAGAKEDMRRSLDKGDVRRVRTHDGGGFIFLILRALTFGNFG